MGSCRSGNMVCADWGFPENIALAIKNHHNPNVDHDLETLGPVRLVSILRQDDTTDGVDELIARAYSSYNISEEKMHSIIEPSFEKAKELAQIIIA